MKKSKNAFIVRKKDEKIARKRKVFKLAHCITGERLYIIILYINNIFFAKIDGTQTCVFNICNYKIKEKYDLITVSKMTKMEVYVKNGIKELDNQKTIYIDK